MGTEVLRPQDCLIERIGVAPAAFHRRKSCYGNGNPRFRKPVFRPDSGRSDQKRRFNSPPEPSISKRSSSSDDLRKSGNSNNSLALGQVTILRRGESHDLKIKAADPIRTPLKKSSGDDPIVVGTELLGPDPEMVLKQIRIGDLKSAASSPVGSCWSDVYAGSAFSMSPSPSSVPLPSFFSKKQVSKIGVDDSATRDLRRLLRLD